uniref:Uncharacterized protein n=1 Tax=Setaria viridis TaxID=4556 RepID=A0A4U6UF24_SETVI|nr:hypothetical protein SEVIR_5G183901v2 [Setaria viridis]
MICIFVMRSLRIFLWHLICNAISFCSEHGKTLDASRI